MTEATVAETIHTYKGSSSSDSETEKSSSPVCKKKRLFGRKEPVHTILGGGKYVRKKSPPFCFNKQKKMLLLISYYGETSKCQRVSWLVLLLSGFSLNAWAITSSLSLIFLLAVLFLWSNAASFVKGPPPIFPEVILPKDMFLRTVHSVRYKINETIAIFRFAASGKDLKKFLMVIRGLWVLSVIGSCFSFLTLFYIFFLLLYSLPALYEKYEDRVDTAAEKAVIEMNKRYAVLDKKLV